MKKKSIAARLGVAAMALTLITTSLSSGTLAKYTDMFQGSTKMIVARWNVGAKVGDKVLGEAKVDLGELANTATEKPANVMTGRIAPGMKGGFELQLDAIADEARDYGTEVDVDYTVYIQADSTANLPAYFTMTCDGTQIDFKNGTPDSEDYGFELASGTIAMTDQSIKKLNINWEWPYDDAGNNGTHDTDDTETGNQMSESDRTTEFTIYVEMTQAKPAAASSTP